MKIFIFFSLLLTLSATSFNQPTTKTGYLEKSKHQLIIACVLLGSGPVAIYINGRHKSFIDSGGPSFIAGSIAIITSISFFIASLRNKKRVIRLLFKNETVPQIQKSSFVYQPVPSLTLKISL